MSETPEICLICMKTKSKSDLTEILSDTQDGILIKLKNCVPEIDWNINFNICYICINELSYVYAFRNLCITSYKLWVNTRLNNISSLTKGDLIKNCLDCELIFKTQKELDEHKNSHVLKVDDIKSKKESCKYCDKLLSTKHSLNKHLKVCKRPKEDIKIEININNESISELIISPTCILCGTVFKNKYLLKRHQKNVHAVEKKFKCDICNNTFASSVYLNAHKKYHSGNRSHICSSCGKGFITASDLYHHEKIHANKRSYHCEICPKAFNTSSDLYKHKICVHSDKTEWKYTCMYCNKKFPLKTNLDTHIRSHTGEKNFSCLLCDKKFINKYVLTKHIESHSNIFSFKCDVCMQSYKYKKSLQIHLTKVHGIGVAKIPIRVKKFICQICSKSYFSNSKLQKHIYSHNMDKQDLKLSQNRK